MNVLSLVQQAHAEPAETVAGAYDLTLTDITQRAADGDPSTLWRSDMTEHYPIDALDKDVKRYLELDELAKDIAAEQATIKTRIRALGNGVYHAPCGVAVSVTPQRRFNPDHAREVIPEAFLPLVEVTVVDGKKAKAALPPAIYEQCQTESGEPRVTFR